MDDGGDADWSTMELERPGEEKKKRREAKAVAKSAAGASVSVSEEETKEELRDLEVVVESNMYRSS